jgi:hypothetical protein
MANQKKIPVKNSCIYMCLPLLHIIVGTLPALVSLFPFHLKTTRTAAKIPGYHP